MYNEKINLTPQEIYEHEFKFNARGYNPQEVDKYLDLIIHDYTEYKKIVFNRDEQIKNLSDEVYTLKQEIRHLEDELASAKEENSANSQKNVTNIDLLKRVSALEKIVYGKNE